MWSLFWSVPQSVMIILGIVLFYLGLCDTLYFLFTVMCPSLSLVNRYRFKLWIESGNAEKQLDFAFHKLPMSKEAANSFGTVFFLLWVLALIVTIVWGAFTLWVPL